VQKRVLPGWSPKNKENPFTWTTGGETLEEHGGVGENDALEESQQPEIRSADGKKWAHKKPRMSSVVAAEKKPVFRK